MSLLLQMPACCAYWPVLRFPYCQQTVVVAMPGLVFACLVHGVVDRALLG
jgi:hypothetical protein